MVGMLISLEVTYWLMLLDCVEIQEPIVRISAAGKLVLRCG